MLPRTLLLTTDLSEEARRAYPLALELARSLDARLTLLHVLPSFDLGRVGAPDPRFGAPREAVDLELEQESALLGNVPVRVETTGPDSVAEAILAFAERVDAGWIVLSTHGRSGLRRLMLGSVAEQVMRSSAIPVLAVPPPAPEADASP